MLDTLKIGIVLPDGTSPAWIVKTIETLAGMNEVEIAVVVHANNDQRGGPIHTFHTKLDKRLFRSSPNAWAEADTSSLLKDVPVVRGLTEDKLETLRSLHLDVLLNFSCTNYPKGLEQCASLGVWTPHDGNVRFASDSAVGWRAVIENNPVLMCALEINRHNQPLQLIGESFLHADGQSFVRNHAYMLWKISAIIPAAVKSLLALGEMKFFSMARLHSSQKQVNHLPSFVQSVFLLIKQVAFTLLKKITNSRTFDQWALLIKPGQPDLNLSWDKFKRILPPKDRIWADPFILERDGQIGVFIEEMYFETRRGTINYLKLDEQANILSNQVVIERPYHLSYPFIFEYDGETYMIPETGGNRTIELYRCTHFPDQWEFHKTLMQDVRAVDATLIKHEGRWWMFVTIAEHGNTTWDTLHLFHADDPLSDSWMPHPLNPVLSDVRTARMAGRIFHNGSSLIRPSQDSSHRYGFGLNLNEITKLSTTEYAEKQIDHLEPVPNSDVKAIHTFNFSTNWTMIDMSIRRSK